MDITAAPPSRTHARLLPLGGYDRARRYDAVPHPKTIGSAQSAGRLLPAETQLPEQPSTPTTDRLAERQAERKADAALAARIVARDERAVEELYQRYSGPVYSLAYQVTRSERFAQDVVQEVFIAVWKDAARFDASKGALAPWLFSLARHKAIDFVRREANVRKRTADVDLDFEVAPDDVHHEAWTRVRRERIVAAIAELSDTQRVALEMAFFGGLTHVEVAERLGVPLGTAKTRIRSALLKLREILGDSVSDSEDVLDSSSVRDR
jgi:RNA polymerase sigma-70 factor, ECF subfamily